MSNIQAARTLGWASLAIGATEILATRWLEEQMGVGEHDALLRTFGVREIGAGVTILAQPGLNKTLAAGLWARVGGDALDLALLGLAGLTTRNPKGLWTVVGLVLAVTGLDIVVATRVQQDLAHATSVAEAARARVTPTQALPQGRAPVTA